MAAHEPSDRALAGAIVEDRDESSFRALYRRHTPSLYPFVLRVLGGFEADAEDVVQDTWLRAVRGLPSFRWESTFRTWLMGIGLNRAREMLRKRKPTARDTALAEVGADPPPLAERMDLERGIECLPEGYRTVLVLHDVEGFTHPEISERLGIAIGTSRSQLHHARKALRRMLDPAEEIA
jgi:RNA polymerase sigma-70 factor (ECF subfamily)